MIGTMASLGVVVLGGADEGTDTATNKKYAVKVLKGVSFASYAVTLTACSTMF